MKSHSKLDDMKTFLITLLFCTALQPVCYCTNKTSAEPLLLADPFIIYYDGLYYAYGTGSDSNKGFDVYVSESLTSWKLMPQKALAPTDSYGDKWFWAPEVYRHPDNGKFYMFYSAEEHLCVATADSPLGPFQQEIQQPIFKEKSIDPSLFLDDDGSVYLYFVRFTGGNVIWCARLTEDWSGIIPESISRCISAELPWEKHMGQITEGPSVLKKDGIYYMLYSANHFMSQDYGVGYATSRNPNGNWLKNAAPILKKPGNRLVGTGHGSIFTDRNGRKKFVFHSHHDTTSIHPRVMHIADISISEGRVFIDPTSIMTPELE